MPPKCDGPDNPEVSREEGAQTMERVWRCLSRYGTTARVAVMTEDEKRAHICRIVAEADAGDRTALAAAPRRGWRPLAAAALVAAAAAAAILLIAVGTGKPTPAGESADRGDQATAPRDGGGFAVRAGAAEPAAGGALPLGVALAAGPSGVAADGFGRIAFMASPGSSFAIREAGGRLELALEQGHVLVSIDPDTQGTSMDVSTRSGRVETTGTIYYVAVETDAVNVKVVRGAVALVPLRGPTATLGEGRGASMESGEQWALTDGEKALFDGAAAALQAGPASVARSAQTLPSLGDREIAGLRPDAPPAGASGGAAREGAEIAGEGTSEAATMLARAREARALRDWAAASAIYEKVVARYPDTAEGAASLVSWGELLLEDLGSPGAALEKYRTYLAQHARGVLVEEALAGEARALRALGRTDEERAALEVFVGRYPSSIQIDAMRRRMAEIDTGEGEP